MCPALASGRVDDERWIDGWRMRNDNGRVLDDAE